MLQAQAEDVLPDPPDEFHETLVSHGPAMFVEAGEEVTARREALVCALHVAVEVGWPEGCVAEIEEIVLGECFDAFRRALTGETPARVAPMRVTLKQGADLSQVKAKPRVYPPEKSVWFKEHFELLCETGMVYPNPQAICASVAMAFPKRPGKGYRLVADFSPINGQSVLVPGPMRNPEIEGEKCSGAVAFCTMDCLQGYWQCPLAEEAHEYFTFVTGDDVKVIRRSVEELIVNLRAVLLRFMERDLFLAAHKLVLIAKEFKWCGKLYSGTAVRHDPEGVRGLVEMRRPETVGELMKFLQATNWMRLSLPHMAEIVAPLRALIEHRLKGSSRTKIVASWRALMDGDWTPERVEARDNSREMLMNAVELSFRRPGDCRVLMFPDASDLFWGCCLTQVPKEKLVAGLSFMDMSHEPLAFLSGVFRGSQLCWPTVHKKSFAILSAFQRVPYLLWDGSKIFFDHRNLVYISSPQSCGVTLSKAASQRLAVWRACMSQFNYVIQHVPGEDNHWGDLLSRWRVLDSEGPLVRANVIAVVARPTGDYQMPPKDKIKNRQDAVACGQVEVATSLGTVTRGEDGSYRVSYQGIMVLWVPEEERELQARLMVCAHMQDAGHRGVMATTHRLGAYCVWDNMEKDIAKFIRQCLHCTDSNAGNAMPRPLGDLVHGTGVGDVLHFDYLSLGESDAIDMGGLVDGGYKHVLVLMDDVSRFVWLEEAVYGCTVHVGVDVRAEDVEVDVIYISFIVSVQNIGYLIPFKDKVQVDN